MIHTKNFFETIFEIFEIWFFCWGFESNFNTAVALFFYGIIEINLGIARNIIWA